MSIEGRSKFEKECNIAGDKILETKLELSGRSVKPPSLDGGYKRPIQEYLAAECIA
jgi:hypothetical protein